MKKEIGRWLKKQIQPEKKILLRTVMYGSIAGICIVIQAALLAYLLNAFIMEQRDKMELIPYFISLILIIPLRAFCIWRKESLSFHLGQFVREQLRTQILNKFKEKGPAFIQTKETGVWTSMLFEQIEEIHDFYAKYLPQMMLAGTIPLIILVSVFPLNWIAGLIFVITMPLVPFFMILVGSKASDANKRNFIALGRLSGHFLDRLQGLRTLKHFYATNRETKKLAEASFQFRKKTMDVLYLAFLSSAVLEFLTAVSIAVIAVYFGFTYLNLLDFAYYQPPVTLFTGLFILVLAPEFFSPLRELGSYYHAKAKAIGASESLYEFLKNDHEKNTDPTKDQAQTASSQSKSTIDKRMPLSIVAKDLILISIAGEIISAPLNFTIKQGNKVSIIGKSGAGKTTLFNTLLGFLPYQGSLTINGEELRTLNMDKWREMISWVGQSPRLFHTSIQENLCFDKKISAQELTKITEQAHIDEFLTRLPKGIDTIIGEQNSGISVGQAQRIALGRAILQDGILWLLDEATASLDDESREYIESSLANVCQNKTRIQITHRDDELSQEDLIITLEKDKAKK